MCGHGHVVQHDAEFYLLIICCDSVKILSTVFVTALVIGRA